MSHTPLVNQTHPAIPPSTTLLLSTMIAQAPSQSDAHVTINGTRLLTGSVPNPTLCSGNHTHSIITTNTLVVRDDSLSSPDTADEDDLELPKFAFKARTRTRMKHLLQASAA
ncbi:hypothetical protein FPV67DRAFT_1657836 [Lyophyllum atratum]|nr:hypothetical protein FPV67DRAFT_1657836 [Lyophyllum atratum]